MQKELKNFLDYIKIKDEYLSYFKDAKIIEAKGKELIEVVIHFTSPVDLILLKVLDQQLKETNLFELVIHYGDQVEITDELINTYFKFILERHFPYLQMKDSLQKINLQIKDETINVPLVSRTQYDLLSELTEEFNRYFQKYGIKYPFYPYLDEKEQIEKQNKIALDEELYLKKVQQEMKELELEQEKQKQQVNPFLEHPLGKNAVFTTISDIQEHDQRIYFVGKIFAIEEIKRRNGSSIFSLAVTDNHDSVTIKCKESRFLKLEQFSNLQVNAYYYFLGNMEFDPFAKETVLNAEGISMAEGPTIKKDYAKVKRVELHLHTKMSTMDAVTNITDYVNRALYYNHPAIAVTDHASIQAFPEFQTACKDKPIKPIYGLEAYMIDDSSKAIINCNDTLLEGATFVHFDLETTGLSARYDKIIEFGAIKVRNGMEIDRLDMFINPLMPLSDFTTYLTGITNSDVQGGLLIKDALVKILKFINGAILVAHNAPFDYEFLSNALKENNLGELNNPVIDTLPLSRIAFSLKSYSLGSVSNHLSIPYDDEKAHRADYDAFVLKQVFEMIIHKLSKDYQIKTLNDLNQIKNPNLMKTGRPTHVTILVKNNQGLKDLYQLVSLSNVEYLDDYPLLPRSVINKFRENLLIGSACYNGEIFDIASTRGESTLLKAMAFYDYIEVQPKQNYSYLVDTKRVDSYEIIERTILDIINGAKKTNKLPVVTGDVHYLDQDVKIARDIYITTLGIKKRAHPLFDYKGRVKENPDQHLRTTDEMLDLMAFLGEELAYETVVTNTNLVADMISNDIFPVKNKLFYPVIENCEEELVNMCYSKARFLYGDPLPLIVVDRIEKETKSIISNKFSVIYYISHKLVKMSLERGYLVGSRGSVGSSFVATLMDITEVNPLPPHYLCPSCRHSEFFTDGSVASGFDLEDKVCPKCGSMMKGEGQNIQFETFLGFKGDKVPDIDLNFSSEFQAEAHNYTKVLLGETKVLRAGTISTVAEKTAFGYVLGYFEKNPNLKQPRRAEKQRLANLCSGVKRTTGQHPGGIIVIPQYLDVHDITPVQYPADEINSSWKTTHFEYQAIHDEVLKLDLLGHVDPSAVRLLQDLTGIDPHTIPFNDPKVLSLFSSKEALNITNPLIEFDNGAAGIPEFGTSIVRRMLDDTKPKLFSELVQISGLSHGTDVWYENAQTLIANNTCTLMEVIGCRDDIMLYLINKGLEPINAFKIMEDVRKGKKVKPEYEEMMVKNNVPKWYIDSCNKIKYMFPKAHAVAYVMMAYRIAWFKIYHPLAYYASYFTLRVDAYEIITMIAGINAVQDRLDYIRTMLKDRRNFTEDSDEKESKLRKLEPMLEVALEMLDRGFKFAPISLERSQAKVFVIDYENAALIPPFITVDGLGENAAESVVKAREERPFLSKADLSKRTQINGTVLMILDRMGVTSKLQNDNQLQFDLF